MMKQITYFYFMKNQPEKIRSIAPSHAEYWQKLVLKDYSGGPFADHSGGLIIFKAESIKDAELKIENDPFVRKGLIEQSWIKEWMVE